MPESTCLHIQDRESGPIRVVELPWISVRIGRAAYCEVCLPDDRLAEETCRLTRRGRTWSLVPSSGQAFILLEGRPLEGPCPLPYDVPFRLGPYCLTLRHDVAAEPDWELYPATAPSTSLDSPPAPQPRRIHRGGSEPLTAETGETSVPTTPEGPGRPTADADRWRARWKAAEDHFKARASRLVSSALRLRTPPERLPRENPSGQRHPRRRRSRRRSSRPRVRRRHRPFPGSSRRGRCLVRIPTFRRRASARRYGRRRRRGPPALSKRSIRHRRDPRRPT